VTLEEGCRGGLDDGEAVGDDGLLTGKAGFVSLVEET